jgi:hypothetical protein
VEVYLYNPLYAFMSCRGTNVLCFTLFYLTLPYFTLEKYGLIAVHTHTTEFKLTVLYRRKGESSDEIEYTQSLYV